MMSAEDQQPEIKSTRNKPGIKTTLLIAACQAGYLNLVFSFVYITKHQNKETNWLMRFTTSCTDPLSPRTENQVQE